MGQLPDQFMTLLVLTAVLAGAIIVRGVRKPEHLPELPLVAASMWMYFYVLMAYSAAVELGSYLPERALLLGQGIAIASFAGLVIGSQLGMRRPRAAGAVRTRQYSWEKLWLVGALLTIAGSVVHYAFISQQEIDWQGTSAYWYLAFHVIYPGLACCIVARVKGRMLHPIERVAFWGLVAFAMFPHVVTARRGPLFPIMMVLVFLPALIRRRKPSRVMLLGALAGTGLAMLAFVAVRPWIYEKGESSVRSISASNWSEALESLSMEDLLVHRTKKLSDNEYVYHCGMVLTNAELGVYQYGTGYLTLLTHWIPRQWWPGKPQLGQGWYGNILEMIPSVTGWQMTTGASAGGVAEVFNQFGWLSPLFWGLIGWFAARILCRARADDDPRWAVGYIGLLCASHWLVSQGFAAAFVPAAVYQIVPWLAFRVARVAPASRAPVHSARVVA